jgi:hypothetical protein
LIKGTNEENTKSSRYCKNFVSKLYAIADDPDNRDLLRQVIFYGVRFANSLKTREESLDKLFWLIDYLFICIGNLTPSELITIFPVDKYYDGDRWQEKDYFFTLEELRKIGMDNRIGHENVAGLLMDYGNKELRKVLIAHMMAASEMRRRQTGKGITEELVEMMGIDTYHMATDPKTKRQYLQNSRTGAISPVKRAKPSYLKLLRIQSKENGYDKTEGTHAN